MSVPKTPIYKNDLFSFSKDYIGLAGQIMPMEPIAIAKPMKKPTYFMLGTGVASSNAPHSFAALGRR